MPAPIRKAIVPVAGLARRLLPLSAVVPKALLPLTDSENRCRPVIHWIAAQARLAGIEQVALVVSPSQEELLRQYLDAARNTEPALPAEIRLLIQPQPKGLGHAVACARSFVGDEPFLLMLGDHVQLADAAAAAPPAAQLLDAHRRFDSPPAAVVAMQIVHESQLPLVGTAAGKPVQGNLYLCTAFAEKPTAAAARARLQTPGLAESHYLAHAGLYAFSPEIFPCIDEVAARATAAEVQLADAQALLLERAGGRYYLLRLAATVLDVGTPENYSLAQRTFATTTIRA